MSRLFSRLDSRLENRGQEQNEGAPPAESAWQADKGADPTVPAPSDSAGDTRTPKAATPAGSPGMPPLVPGYTISSSLASSPREPAARPARPVWPVRLWLASLLLLIGLSLLMLAMPERLLPLEAQQRPASPAPDASAASTPDPATARQAPLPPENAVATVVPPVPAARPPRAEPRISHPAPTPAPPAPSRSGSSTACSDAMLAMNLCSKSSP